MPYVHGHQSRLADPCQASWVHLISPLTKKRVLRMGSERAEVDRTLLAYGCQELILVRGKRTESMGTERIRLVASLEGVPDGSCDVVVVDGWDPLGAGWSGRQAFSFLSSLRKKGGPNAEFVLCLPDLTGIRGFLARRGVLAWLRAHSAYAVERYVCSPGALFPEVIVPCKYHLGFLLGVLEEGPGRTGGGGIRRIKEGIKDRAKRWHPLWNPFWGIIAVVRTEGTRRGTAGGNAVETGMHAVRRKREDLGYALFGKRYVPKQNLLVFDLSRRECIAVGKMGNRSFHRGNVVERETRVLEMLHRHRSRLDAAGIRIAEPLFYQRRGDSEVSVEGRVRGVPLSEVAGRKPGMWETQEMQRLLFGLVEKRWRLQEVLLAIGHELGAVGASRFQVAPASPLEGMEGLTGDGSEAVEENVEHGDFTDVNLLIAEGEGGIGVIDWEWTQRGYPHGYDVFSLMESIGYTEDAVAREDEFVRYRRSFISTFFRRNGFSRTVAQLLVWYYGHLGLDREAIYSDFLRYLLGTHNKYRENYNLPAFEDLYGWKMLYSREHREAFIASGQR